MLITAPFPMIKLWDSILERDENLDAKQVEFSLTVSLCSRFCSSIFKHPLQKRFPGVFNLVDKQPNKSELALSPWLFGSNLEEQIKRKLHSSTISREIPKLRASQYKNQKQHLPNSQCWEKEQKETISSSESVPKVSSAENRLAGTHPDLVKTRQ